MIQYLQRRDDKSDIKLNPAMTVGASMLAGVREVTDLIDFELEVVNVGRRVARIDEVGIFIKGKKPSKNSHGMSILIFDSKEEGVVSLEEREKRVFQLRRWSMTLQDMAEHFADYEEAYVRLTSGKRISERFKTISMSKLQTLRKNA